MATPCSECRRRKIKCDDKVPCSTCIRRGSPESCRQDTKTVEELSQTVSQLRRRIAELEAASPNSGSTPSGEPYPSLIDAKLETKPRIARFESEEISVSADFNTRIRPEDDVISVRLMKDTDATGFHSPQKQRISASNSSIPSSTQLRQSQPRPSQITVAGSSPQQQDSFQSDIQQKHNADLVPKPLLGACSRCKLLKVKCEYFDGSATCKRCLNTGHKCVIGKRKARTAVPKRERLINDIRMQAEKINQLMLQLETVQHPIEVSPDLWQGMPSTPAAFSAPSQRDSLADPGPVSKNVNPRIEQWLLGAKQSLRQFQNSLPDPGRAGDEGSDESDSASWVDDDLDFSEYGSDADEDFQSSLPRKPGRSSSLNTAITSLASSRGFSGKRGSGEARTPALTVIRSSVLEGGNIQGDSEREKEVKTGMRHPGQDLETPSSAGHGLTTRTASLLSSSRGDRLSTIFSQPIIKLALLNFHANGTRPHCHSGTRENVLRKIRSCFRDTNGWDGVMFLRGAVGVGKTAIMQTLAERERKDKRTVATVFYERKFWGKSGIFHLLVFPILAYQLALQDESYANDVVEVLNRSVLGEPLQTQFDLLITEPWARRRSEATSLKPWLIILDGLDGHGYSEIVQLISHYACTAAPKRISWIISTPPEPLTLPFPLVSREVDISIGSDDACEDMEGYLRNDFDAICKRFPTRISGEWPSEDDFLRVTTTASGYFAFAASIINFVGDPSVADPVGQLDTAIAYISGRSRNKSPFATLDRLYSDTLDRASPSALPTAMLLISLFLISSVRFSKTPPSIVVACNILRLSEGVAHSSLSQLSALLDIPPVHYAHSRPLKFLHSSFEDFLLDPARSGAQYLDFITHKAVIQQCCTTIAQQVNGTPEQAGGLEHIQLIWCPTDCDEEEERKKVYVFAARILASLWEPVPLQSLEEGWGHSHHSWLSI